jgi:hypothetical protein
VLVGRRTLAGKFIVDVTKSHFADEGKVFKAENQALNQQLQQDAYSFYKEHYKPAGVSVRSKKS